jgi:hypothetical protein
MAVCVVDALRNSGILQRTPPGFPGFALQKSGLSHSVLAPPPQQSEATAGPENAGVAKRYTPGKVKDGSFSSYFL